MITMSQTEAASLLGGSCGAGRRDCPKELGSQGGGGRAGMRELIEPGYDAIPQDQGRNLILVRGVNG